MPESNFLTQLTTEIDELTGAEQQNIDEISNKIVDYHDYVQSWNRLNSKATEFKSISDKAQVASQTLAGLDGEITETTNNKKNMHLRNIQTLQYEYARYKDQKQFFKTLTLICAIILAIVFIQRAGYIPKSFAVLFIIILGAFMFIYTIDKWVVNQRRHNILFDVKYRSRYNSPHTN